MSLVSSRKGIAGFSLVELMVSMVLGLMLIAGAVSVYLASKQSYREVEQVAALTENARFAEQLVGDSLRHLGFLGSVTPSRVEVDSALTATALTGDCTTPAEAGAYNLNRLAVADTVAGTYSSPGDVGTALGCITDAFLPRVDTGVANNVLVIKHVLPRPYTSGPRVPDPSNPPSGVIDTPGALQNGKVYVMTNNIGGLMFDGSTPPTITSGGEFPGGNAWEYQYEVYYVRDLDPASEEGRPQLSRRMLVYNGTGMEFVTEEVADGVERLRLMFGFDDNGDGEVDSYRDVDYIQTHNKWADVESVEVYMLVRSATEDVQYTDEKEYQLGGQEVGPYNDNYRRLISFASLSLRNLKLMIRGDAS